MLIVVFPEILSSLVGLMVGLHRRTDSSYLQWNKAIALSHLPLVHYSAAATQDFEERDCEDCNNDAHILSTDLEAMMLLSKMAVCRNAHDVAIDVVASQPSPHRLVVLLHMLFAFPIIQRSFPLA
jgi:hypothetical protein